MKQPNNQQLLAIQHSMGPALVLAGPGSGKTFTIIQRILYLIRCQHVSPEKILVVTFSKAAALEMYERYQSAISKDHLEKGVHFGTFHSLGFHILQNASHLDSHALISESEKRQYLEITLRNLGYASLCHYEKVVYLLDCFSSKKNCPDKEIPLSVLELSYEEFQQIKTAYDNFLSEQGKIDFDDMILQCVSILQRNDSVLIRYQKEYEFFLIDEFQDINQPQYEMIRLLSGTSGQIYAVGDDDQSIYGFRGSTPDVMKVFLKDYPCTSQYVLSHNFRSGSQIVKFSEEIINRNQSRLKKEFVAQKDGGSVYVYHFDSHKEEEEQLVIHLKEHSSDCLQDTAIILRTNHEASLFRRLMRKNEIPVHSVKKEQNIFDSFLMDDILAFLCYLYEGRKRTDFLQFMNKPNHYFQREALISETVRMDDFLKYYRHNFQMQQQIRQYFYLLQFAEKLLPSLAIHFFCQQIGYYEYLKKKSRSGEEYEQYKAIAESIQHLFKSYTFHYTIRDFIQNSRKEYGTGSRFVEEKGIHVITMHASKGLEFKHVYLPDVNEGIIPSKKSRTTQELEEERRLLYVAITRAKTKLFLYETAERNRSVSRFLEGIIPQNPDIHQIPDYPDIRQKHLQPPHTPHHH